MDIELRYSQEATLFGKQIRKIRKFRELTQPLLSTVSSITQPEISLLENGSSNFAFHTLMKLANGLKVKTIDLFDYKKEDRFDKLRLMAVDKRFIKEKESFGKRIEQLIRNKGTIQEDFAISTGFDPGDLSRFVNGEHNIEFINIVRIAEGLEVELINLFDYKGFMD